MKKIKAYSIIVITAVLMSCNNEPEGEYIQAGTRSGTAHIRTIIVDSCEYLYDSNVTMAVPIVLTHKGNCKYCAARHNAQ